MVRINQATLILAHTYTLLYLNLLIILYKIKYIYSKYKCMLITICNTHDNIIKINQANAY